MAVPNDPSNIGIVVPGVIEDNVPVEFVTFMDYCR